MKESDLAEKKKDHLMNCQSKKCLISGEAMEMGIQPHHPHHLQIRILQQAFDIDQKAATPP